MCECGQKRSRPHRRDLASPIISLSNLEVCICPNDNFLPVLAYDRQGLLFRLVERQGEDECAMHYF